MNRKKKGKKQNINHNGKRLISLLIKRQLVCLKQQDKVNTESLFLKEYFTQKNVKKESTKDKKEGREEDKKVSLKEIIKNESTTPILTIPFFLPRIERAWL